MILEFTLEVLKELDSKGVSWGAVLTALLLWNKLVRNKEFKQRDERVERNQRRIMIHLGVEGGEWSTPRKTLKQTALLSLEKWYSLLRREIQWGNLLIRRVTKMNQSINWLTLIPAVFGAVKLILQPFGIDLSGIADDKVNDIANGVAALATVIGIFASHRKGETNNGTGSAAKYTGDGPAV